MLGFAVRNVDNDVDDSETLEWADYTQKLWIEGEISHCWQ